MARQLAARGKKVHFLAMFDTILHKTIKIEPAHLGNLYHIPRAVKKGISKLVLKVDFETFLLRKHTRQSIRYKVNSFRALIDKINRKKLNPGEIEYIGLKIFDESADIYVAAYKNYKLLPYGGDIVLFYAKEHYYFLDRDKNVGYKKLHLEESTKNLWRQYAVNTFIHEIEGEHSGIFDPIHGDKFAMVLQQYLNNPPI
jgi:thioesterase domain-containing protein